MTRPRRDPTGTRALFEAPAQMQRDVQAGQRDAGRTLLYSGADARPGTVLVDCRACGARSRIGLAELGVRMVPTLFMPVLRHPHWLRCPACERRTWCRIGWTS